MLQSRMVNKVFFFGGGVVSLCTDYIKNKNKENAPALQQVERRAKDSRMNIPNYHNLALGV
jgi:hypothetical protein